MKSVRPSPATYPLIEHHGVIGDRRTGALVSADGTLDWFCAPDFDSAPVFGALLDPNCGGYCRFGPPGAKRGQQRYGPETARLMTSWPAQQELSDLMAWPDDERPDEFQNQRVIIRHLKAATEGSARAMRSAIPRWPRSPHPYPNASVAIETMTTVLPGFATLLFSQVEDVFAAKELIKARERTKRQGATRRDFTKPRVMGAPTLRTELRNYFFF
jgi:hypothetical protein